MLPSVHITIPWWASTQYTTQVQGTTTTWIPSFSSQISGDDSSVEGQAFFDVWILKQLVKKNSHDTESLSCLISDKENPPKLQVQKIISHTFGRIHEKNMIIFNWFNPRRNPWVISLVTLGSSPKYGLEYWVVILLMDVFWWQFDTDL